MPWYVELVGALAGFLTTVAFLPQAVQTWRTKSVRDISLASYICLVTGVSTWMVYGFFIGSWPIIIANAVSFGIQLPILIMKLYYGKRCAAVME